MKSRQLKIWKEDFLRYYDKTSVLMRIVIGAVLSALTALLLINKVIKPQNAELKTLKQKYQSMEVIDDVDIQVADLKNKQRKAAMQVEGLQKANEQLTAEIGKNILDLRTLIDRYELRIVSEERVVPVKEKKSGRRGRKKVEADTRLQISFPASMACESYQFVVLGSYKNLRAFLNDVRNARSLFFLNNISIRQSEEMLTDKELNQYRALSCTFEVHVPYRSGQQKAAGKK